jgi:hypothetical protein
MGYTEDFREKCNQELCTSYSKVKAPLSPMFETRSIFFKKLASGAWQTRFHSLHIDSETTTRSRDNPTQANVCIQPV